MTLVFMALDCIDWLSSQSLSAARGVLDSQRLRKVELTWQQIFSFSLVLIRIKCRESKLRWFQVQEVISSRRPNWEDVRKSALREHEEEEESDGR